MEWRLIYEDLQGTCKIVVPSAKYRQPEESEENAIARLWLQAIPGAIEFIACKADKIPLDFTFREAWKKGDTHEPIKIDFSKALEIHRKRIEVAAAKKSSLLQIQLEEAKKGNNLPLRVAIQRTCEILVKLHAVINLSHCKTPEDIKYSIPRELHEVWDFYPPVSPT